MNKEEAIKIFSGIASLAKINTEPTMSVCNIKNEVFIEVLQALLGPWVKTADRLPDKCDETNYLIARHHVCREWHTLQVTGLYIKKFPTHCPWWMPIPPLPEVKNEQT